MEIVKLNDNNYDELTTSTPPTNIYCPVDYQNFWKDVESLALNITLVLAIFGILANFLCLLVFTRKVMVNSTNVILAGISMADLIAMAAFIPEYVSELDYIRENHAYATAVIWVIHEYFISVFHPVSTWLTTTLALWRYIAVIHPHRKYLCTMRRIKIIIAGIFLISFSICIPSYLPGSVHIVATNETLPWKEGGCGAKFCSHWTAYSLARKVEFWYQGFVSKVIPSIVLPFVSTRLIMAVVMASRRRKLMRVNDVTSERLETPEGEESRSEPEPGLGHGNVNGVKMMNDDFDRVTKMLITLMLLFLITEIPPGGLYVLEIFYGADFYFECRRPVHYFIITMYFLSGVLNFVVYVVMNRNFRGTLVQILCGRGQGLSWKRFEISKSFLRDFYWSKYFRFPSPSLIISLKS